MKQLKYSKEHSPLVSVIIPVYNVEKYLCECVGSILNQTYKNFEIILVDDGSTDNSGQICDDYVKNDHRVKVIHKENAGAATARNIGLDNACGDYIVFVDSDDFCAANMLQCMVNVAIAEEVPLVMSTGYYHSSVRNKRISSKTEKYISKLNSEKMVNEWLWTTVEKTILYTIVVAKLYKRAFFGETLRFVDGLSFEDEEFTTRLYLKPYDIIFIDEPLYFYRANTESSMYKPFSHKRIDVLSILYNRCKIFKTHSWDEMSMKAAKNFCDVYIEFGIEAMKINHLEWVLDKQREFKEMKRFLGLRGHIKDRIRYLIFGISPKIYKKLFCK